MVLLLSVGFGQLDTSMTATADRALGGTEQVGILFAAIAGGSTIGGLVFGARSWPFDERRALAMHVVVVVVTGDVVTGITEARPPQPLVGLQQFPDGRGERVSISGRDETARDTVLHDRAQASGVGRQDRHSLGVGVEHVSGLLVTQVGYDEHIRTTEHREEGRTVRYGRAQEEVHRTQRGGNLLDAAHISPSLAATLATGADKYTWMAAATGSNVAAGFQLATGYPVMPIGGFNGSDPSPTLEEFQAYVEAGDIHWFIAGGGGPGGGGGMGGGPGGSSSSTTSAISSWVSSNFTATTVDGVTLYDLTAPATS